MGRHYKGKDRLIHGLIKLSLLAALSIALFFVVYRLYPEKFSPFLSDRVETITTETVQSGSKVADLLSKDEDAPKVISSTKPEIEYGGIPPAISKDIIGKDAAPIRYKGKKPLLAIVVDDGGNSLEMAKRVASLKLPLTWAILPYTRYANETSVIAADAGIPYLLHLPMQAEIDKDSKEYLVGVGMDRQKIKNVTVKALDSLPSPIGINNHRGSLATSKRDIMVPIMDVLKERDLLFFDSRTSGKSVAYGVAVAAGITAFKNGLFLDGTPDQSYIRARFEQAVQTTQKKRDIIVICHFRPDTILFLEKLNKEYTELPVRLVTLPEMAKLLVDTDSGEE